MTRRENMLRSVRFERPERIPMVFWINPACRNHYPRQALDELKARPELAAENRRDALAAGALVRGGLPHGHTYLWIRDRFKGRVCIDLDIDRQKVTRFGTPRDVDELIRAEVEMLGSREGGLMMVYGMYPGIPLANAKALMDAMEKYSTRFS
jgi:hypothetical protein